MQGDPQIVQRLNLCLRDQLTAINQFFLHARMARDWGLHRFDEYECKRSLRAMKTADELIGRVLFLDGLPNLQDLGKLLIGETVPEIVDGDLELLGAVRKNLQESIRQCEEARDFVSRDLLQGILEEIEEQIDWVETQQYLIENVGVENYLQAQMGDGA
jgi:bacterioferritin